MIRLSQQRKTIDADDLLEILKEMQDGLVAYEHKTVARVIELIESLPDLSEREEIKDILP